MINKLQSLKDKTKVKFFKNISNYYIEMKNKNFQTQEYPLVKIYHEELKLMKFLQTKSKVENMNINYFDLYYTVIKTRDENKDIDNQYENDDND